MNAHNKPICIRRNWALALHFLAAWACTALTGPARSYAVDPAAETASHTWAILIGVEKYHHATPLRFTLNDVVKLGETLQTYGGVPQSHFREMIDTAKDPRLQPLRSSIMAELPEFLKKPTADDTVIVYFTGHGFRDDKNQMYLAPIDCNPEDPTSTGIPIAWVREQIAGCKAKFKLLVIDACHAGSEKGDDDLQSLVAGELGKPFEDLEGVVTLASSTAAEKSQIWDDVQQSLFSYWLRQGLKGHADTKNVNGLIDVDELYEYVYNRVTSTSEDVFQRKQTPIRIVRSGTPGVPNVVALQPQPLNQVMADMVEQLGLELRRRNMRSIGVVEFLDHSELQSTSARRNFGLLGKRCAKDLQDELNRQAQGRFSVVSADAVREVMEDRGITVAGLSSPRSLKQLGEAADGLPVLAVGKFKSRDGWLVSLEVSLHQTGGIETVGTAAGYAALSENDWAELGKSAIVGADDYRPQVPRPNQPIRPASYSLIPRLDERAEGDHPLKAGELPFQVRVFVGQEERKPVFRGNNAYVDLKRGEVYYLEIENKSGKVAMMRLLVDGLNTLPQKEETKGVITQIWAPRVSLERARHWELDPKYSVTNRVRGFFTVIDAANSEYREFKVVDADQSLAAQQRFPDQIGLITVAFYAPVVDARGTLGTGAGEKVRVRIDNASYLKPGNLLGVVHIRYGEPTSAEQ